MLRLNGVRLKEPKPAIRSSVYVELALWQRSCAVLMNLVEFMTEQHNHTSNILSGMAELFEENRKQRAAELAGLHDRLSYLSRQVEAMRATHSRNLEALSDRMHERTELSEKRYTEIMTEINSLKERIGDLEKLVYEMANHLPQPTEASSEQQ